MSGMFLGFVLFRDKNLFACLGRNMTIFSLIFRQCAGHLGKLKIVGVCDIFWESNKALCHAQTGFL